MARRRNVPEPEVERGPRRYEVVLTRAAERKFAALPKAIAPQIGARLETLAEDPRPHGVKKLRGEDDLYRVRVGDYRVVYTIADERLVVLVVNLGHRKDIYESL